jgi:tight adherence protein C
MLALTILSIFVSVALLSGVALYPYLSRREIVRGRVAQLMPREEEQPNLLTTPGKWQRLLADMGTRLKMKPGDLRTFRQLMTAAGYRAENVHVFLGAKLFLTMALPACCLFLFALPRGKVSGVSLLILVACAIGGYLLPTFWLGRKAEQRKTEIFHALPDVLDLLTVCVEAGLSLNAALVKTVENYQDRESPLIVEINTVTQEIRMGKPRGEALRDFAERTGVDDIKAFVAMLIQTERFGTSLGKTLRIYSDSLRTKRKQLAEEQAAKTSVKMLIPLTFCVFPALLVVILTPAVFKIFALFAKH